ncbi:TaqI-like C-terminal specificity domain-containing protein [Snodgrassella sp. CFCC 13594]|uniref:Eco57I restriction-modification methylase domain-containing protein n=1 Tax=Snodgrassella sp. CFCC 13594 TaxID=1775559 RepID=UPI0008355AF7|nr:TaqI-like C-terminal specificity domain-containing protein [Snodgrassella sp. CFCC 13594]
MSLFQSIIVKKYLNNLNKEEVDQVWDKFHSHFQDNDIQDNIKKSKEEQYQEGFLRDLFVNIFNYVLNPTAGFNLTTELKNIKGSKKCDGAILKDSKALAVIELKGMDTTDLASIEDQAFGYKNNHPTCRYVMTSNFQKLRFYIDNAVEFIEFDLFKITREDFNFLFLLLKSDNLLADLPLKIKSESISQEEKITKQLYQDYSTFRQLLFKDLVEKNPQYNSLTLFQKSQKLLDRLLFIFFAEDSGLLAANTARTMLKEWEHLKDLKMPISVYDQLKRYFNFLNTGYKDNISEIFAYNGGLFKPDDVLDNVKISDDVLKPHISKLADYDFSSEVDVNILGRIFENSLTEIDEIKAKLNGDKLDKSQSKRKKDGVFYTPKYITNYIVQNTIGKLCSDKKAEIGILDADYIMDKKRQKKTQEALLQKLKDYREWLLAITICDPACGSGAFLNEALNFLMTEHAYLDELESKLFGGGLVFQEVRNHILENNLFGVDINQESVEIAKLSLWLRTAEPHRKLSNLNENLKCGNSLIDEASVAGDKAFDWKYEFPNVFKNGGFDVIIGNPPYGAKIDIKQLSHLQKKYEGSGLNKIFSDTYVLFYILGLNHLIKDEGLLGYIAPNTWRTVINGNDFRQYLLKNFSIHKIVQHTEKVFTDATVDVDTIIIKNSISENNDISVIIGSLKGDYKVNNVNQSELLDQAFINLSLSDYHIKIKKKIENQSYLVKDLLLVKNGTKPYEKGKGQPAQTAETLKTKPFTSEIKIDDSFSPLIGGSNFNRYVILWNNDNWIKYGEWLAAPRDKAIFNAPEKLIFRQTSDKLVGVFVDSTFIMRDNTHIILSKQNSQINLKFALALLNSKLANFYYQVINPEKGEALAQVKAFHLENLPIKKIPLIKQENFIIKVDEILYFNQELKKLNNKFLRMLERKFNLTESSKNLQGWRNLTYSELIKELGKKKIKLSLADEAEWEDYFLAEQQNAQSLQAQIIQTDKEIDNMVYQLYGLTDDEIKIIESY